MAGRWDIDKGHLRPVRAPRVQVDAVVAVRGGGGRGGGAAVKLSPPTMVAQRPRPIGGAEYGGIVKADCCVHLAMDSHNGNRHVARRCCDRVGRRGRWRRHQRSSVAGDRRHEVRGLDRHTLRHHASCRMTRKIDTHRVDAGLGREDLRRDRAQKISVINVELRLPRLATAAPGIPAPGHALRRHQDEAVLICHVLPTAESEQMAGACGQAVQLHDEWLTGGVRDAGRLVLEVESGPAVGRGNIMPRRQLGAAAFGRGGDGTCEDGEEHREAAHRLHKGHTAQRLHKGQGASACGLWLVTIHNRQMRAPRGAGRLPNKSPLLLSATLMPAEVGP